MDRLEGMRAFVAVAEQGGFARAARKLGVSPVLVTRQIAALEEALSARLLQRTTRSVTLTEAGARFLERVRPILQDLAEAEAAASAERTVPQGRLVVTAPVLFGRMHVAPLMCRYLERYPNVRGELHLSDVRQNLIEEGYDVALRVGHLEDSSLIARRLGETRRVVVAAPHYLRRATELREPADLANHDAIQFLPLVPRGEWTFQHLGEARSVRIDARFVTNSADAALGHAELGGGVVMALSYQVQERVELGRLQIVLADFEPPVLPIHVVYPAAKLLAAKVGAFVELLQTESNFNF